ncbi:MAG TPA: hypothetical protein PK379_01085 [Candidatus Hydrogenedentes bacterium]|nr:hypothetical protein [Candidatus Hydrogenedentota bacterium]HOJ68562.1 hypothetical protein [Candidatus Hydrogenedentota bacterium]HOK88596.1 hypothetical protein [Candidatus Hydrogenedentota bacterium]
MEERKDPILNEPETSQQEQDDGFGDTSPVIRPWLLVLMVFALLAGLTASAVMNASESVAASSEKAACSACPFAKAAARVKAGSACPMKQEKAAPVAAGTDPITAYEAALKQVEEVTPDLSPGTPSMALAAQAENPKSDESNAKSGTDAKKCDEKKDCDKKSSSGDGSAGTGKNCPAGKAKSCPMASPQS